MLPCLHRTGEDDSVFGGLRSLGRKIENVISLTLRPYRCVWNLLHLDRLRPAWSTVQLLRHDKLHVRREQYLVLSRESAEWLNILCVLDVDDEDDASSAEPRRNSWIRRGAVES